ncbi:MAG: DNA repair protein RecN [Bdellovibrio sp.]|nr:MAG: DNA repair protein RecN [Bdellovibrio sp.]
MLVELKVQNFAIIDNIHIQFGPGLNILSGETGAGKSVLLRSLALLMGAKGSVESIRAGQHQASVEGFFDLSGRKDLLARLDELGIEVEERMLIVRRVLSGEKSRVYLNGVLATLGTLRELVSPLVEVSSGFVPLIEMTGQHESRSLLQKSYHLDLLDQYTGSFDLRHIFDGKFAAWKDLQREIGEFEERAKTQAQRGDFLKYQRDEIVALQLSPGQDAEIESELKRMKNAAKLGGFLEMAEEILDGREYSLLQGLARVVSRAQELHSLDPGLSSRVEGFAEAKERIEQGLFELRAYGKNLEGDPQRMEELETRLSQLRKLQKKFGSRIEEILHHLQSIETELSQLENADEHLRELNTQAEKLRGDLHQLASQLHERRQNGAKLLADSVNDELRELNMKGVRFHVEIHRMDSLTSTGFSDVEFQTQPSLSSPKYALAKVASGGELSRILLSLKRVVGTGKYPRTYLFDEVDTGVSGQTAEKVGKKLHSIAQKQQVICVTHLPQVAAYGDIHFFIEKEAPASTKTSVSMNVRRLGKKERIEEIARLISGQKVTSTSRAHAEVLLKQAQA